MRYEENRRLDKNGEVVTTGLRWGKKRSMCTQLDTRQGKGMRCIVKRYCGKFKKLSVHRSDNFYFAQDAGYHCECIRRPLFVCISCINSGMSY